MNRKSQHPAGAAPNPAIVSRHQVLLREILLRVLRRAREGRFIVREQGIMVAAIGVQGHELHAEVDVLDTRLYARVLLGGDTAAAEAYMEGWWTSPDLACVIRFFARNLDMTDNWDKLFGWLFKPASLLRLGVRRNSRKQARRNISRHYDLEVDFYRGFLDRRMQYSGAIFNRPGEALAEAQLHKLNRICELLDLRPDDHLLEVGCGWGGLAIHAARHWGSKVTAVTNSCAQFEYVHERVLREGLENRIEVVNRDYRQLKGSYDKLVSVEMIEAVGRNYLATYFRKLNELLKPGGRLMLQAITIADQRYAEYSRSEDFIRKHVFPGGFLPSLSVICELMGRKTDLVMRDLLDIGLDYADTLARWRESFLENLEALRENGYPAEFLRLWDYYFAYCEGGFRERRISAVQLLASKAPH
ncbi:MAG: class I SAM-dependent methyltransferase [Gammaproteobacteria bacterium]|nr:class I SAM-dependent methyltransferase [Gammaproteobacteria bacterium]MYH85212.1 class I SAM-dependent methyltransferase [Gammaproteobacteria bacterium]MYK04727.1 class I SAM-dependent methyltransferase [Gammaproteobacteria bacterium]